MSSDSSEDEDQPTRIEKHIQRAKGGSCLPSLFGSVVSYVYLRSTLLFATFLPLNSHTWEADSYSFLCIIVMLCYINKLLTGLAKLRAEK